MESGQVLPVAQGISSPDGLAIDANGVMYVGSRSSNKIYHISPGGQMEVHAKLRCAGVIGMAVDSDGNLYVAGRDKVFKLTPNKEVEELVQGFKWAEMVALDSKGNLFITDARQNKVFKLTADGMLNVFIDNTIGVLDESSWYVTGIVIDEESNFIYTCNYYTGQILKYPILPNGQAGDPIHVASANQPTQMVMDENGQLYVTCFSGSIIYVTPRGVEPIAKTSSPTAIVYGRGALDWGSVYITNLGSGKVSRVKVHTRGR